MLTKIAYGWLILALDSIILCGSFLWHMEENDFGLLYYLFGQKLGITLMLSLILSRVEDKDEDFKIHRRHIAMCHVVFTIIDLVLLTIHYYWRVYGLPSAEQCEFLFFAI